MEHFDFKYFKYSKKTNAKLIRERKRVANSRDILVKLKASELAYDYYDGRRIYGYGGFKYDGRWKKFLPKIIKNVELIVWIIFLRDSADSCYLCAAG